VRLYSSIILDEYDQFAADATDPDPDDPGAHGVIRLREFSIQGEAAALRRFAAAVLNAADLAEKAVSP
jgi:hypothetical protein